MITIIRRKFYSDLNINNFYLDQREFGFIQDVKRSGLSRTLKRNVGRFRNKLGR